MSLRPVIGMAVLIACSPLVHAQEQKKTALAELQKEMASLRQHKKAKVQQTHALFKHLIDADKLTVKELDQHRKQLVEHRDHLLEISQSPAEKRAIHERFDPLIKRMGAGERQEKKDVLALRHEEKHTVALIQKQYDAAIGAMHKQIDAAKNQPSKAQPKKATKTQPNKTASNKKK